MRNPLAAFRQRADRRADASPAGCCECGTGGPHYRGRQPQVTRYVYVDATGADGTGGADWVSCSRHPLTGHVPAVDYGRDIPKTHTEVDADLSAALNPQHAGYTLGQLRHLTAGLPDTTQIQIEDTSRTGTVPGSYAVHPITDADVIPDSVDTSAVYLLIQPED